MIRLAERNVLKPIKVGQMGKKEKKDSSHSPNRDDATEFGYKSKLYTALGSV
jgi:hypothetical protein